MCATASEAPSGSTAVELGAYAIRQARRLRKRVAAAARSGEVDAVHDLRVASRRLQEALRVMAEVLPARKVNRTCRDARRLRRAFRKVRDLDVMLASLSEARLEPAIRARLEGLLVARRDRKLRRALEKTHQISTRRIQRGVKRLADAVARECGRDEAGRLLRERARTRVEQLVAHAVEHECADLHPVRIGLKRVRYSAELLERVGGLSADDSIERFARMQDRLGHWNDCITAARFLSKVAGRRSELVDSGWSGSLLKVAADYLASADRERAQIVHHWPELMGAVTKITQAVPEGAVSEGDGAGPSQEQRTP